MRGVSVFTGFFLVYSLAGTVELQEHNPATPSKSKTQEQIEQLVPDDVAEKIIEVALRSEEHTYPKTIAAIISTESGGDPAAVGDDGDSRGVCQVQEKHWSRVPEDLEGQIEQCTQVFLSLVAQHGYREAVKRFNGSGRQARKYQRTVLKKVVDLDKKYR